MMLQDEADARDLQDILALLPEDVTYPCEVAIAERDEQGRVKSINVIPGDNHARK